MGEQAPHNPFAALFSATDQAQESQQNVESTPATNEEISAIEQLAREVFFLTCRKTSSRPLVFLELSGDNVDITWLGEALFERLLLTEVENHVIPSGRQIPNNVIEGKVISYLYESWCRLQPRLSRQWG